MSINEKVIKYTKETGKTIVELDMKAGKGSYKYYAVDKTQTHQDIINELLSKDVYALTIYENGEMTCRVLNQQ